MKQWNNRAATWLPGLARGMGSLVAGFWLFIAIMSVAREAGTWTTEAVVMTGLILAAVLSVGLAWWRERIGGLVLILVALAHGAFAYVASGHSRGYAVLVAGGPWLLVGIAFLAAWWARTGLLED